MLLKYKYLSTNFLKYLSTYLGTLVLGITGLLVKVRVWGRGLPSYMAAVVTCL